MPDVTFESSAESRKSGGFSEHHLPVRVADSGDRAICAYALQHPMKFIAHESIARARLSLTGPSYYGLLSGSKPLAHSGSTIQRNRSPMRAYISSAPRYHLPVASSSISPFASPDRVLLRQVPADGRTPSTSSPSPSPSPGSDHVILSLCSFSRLAA